MIFWQIEIQKVCFIETEYKSVDFFKESGLKFNSNFILQAANSITKIEGLERLEHLATLHLRDNKVESLDGFSEAMKNLQYVNLR